MNRKQNVDFDVQKEARTHSYVWRVTQFRFNSSREAFVWRLPRNLCKLSSGDHRALASALKNFQSATRVDVINLKTRRKNNIYLYTLFRNNIYPFRWYILIKFFPRITEVTYIDSSKRINSIFKEQRNVQYFSRIYYNEYVLISRA